MRDLIKILILIVPFSLLSQTRIYKGFLGKSPIELITKSYSDGVVNAIYVYSNFDTPIKIDGNYKNGELILREKTDEKLKAQLKFENFSTSQANLTGKWIDAKNLKEYKIKLTKVYEFESYDKVEITSLEVLQNESTDKHYFKTIVKKDFKEILKVIGLKIFEKRTDKLIQSFELDCDYRHFNNIYTSDYNFDNITDFSIFEFSYAGPNTSSIYFLMNPITEKYEKADFEGNSLEFDNEKKLIYEHNQCCAGNAHMNATYKVVNNKMVLIKKKCIKYNNEKDNFEETECN